MSEQTKRIEALDIAKGIGIILVIIGHMSSSYLRDWIYSFHMPLFLLFPAYASRQKNIHHSSHF